MRITYSKSKYTGHHFYQCECGAIISKKIELVKNPHCRKCGNKFLTVEIIAAKNKYIEQLEATINSSL